MHISRIIDEGDSLKAFSQSLWGFLQKAAESVDSFLSFVTHKLNIKAIGASSSCKGIFHRFPTPSYHGAFSSAYLYICQ